MEHRSEVPGFPPASGARRVRVLAAIAAACLPGCHRAPPPSTEVHSEPVATTAPGESAATTAPAPSSSAVPANDGPFIGAKVIAATVYKLPDIGSRKLGYIRLGGRVKRDAEPRRRQGLQGRLLSRVADGLRVHRRSDDRHERSAGARREQGTGSSRSRCRTTTASCARPRRSTCACRRARSR